MDLSSALLGRMWLSCESCGTMITGCCDRASLAVKVVAVIGSEGGQAAGRGDFGCFKVGTQHSLTCEAL
jgi:hypothetical protein